MPALALEPFIFPETLFDGGTASQDNAGHWWCLHTRPRTEKSLSRRLLQRGHAFFLPLHERRQRVQRRSVVSYLPLFPSYLFLRGTDEARIAALETGLVVRSLPVENQQQLEHDLARIYGLIVSGEPLTPESQLSVGAPAEVVHGPFAGYRGTVLRAGSSTRFVVEVKFLQRGVSVEVDAAMVQPV